MSQAPGDGLSDSGDPFQPIREMFDQPLPITNYLCHWSMKNRFVYVETPKAACTTIKRVLQQAEVGGGMTYEKPGDVHLRERSPLLTPCEDMAGFSQAMRDQNYFRFCFVRNPFSRILSCYLDKMVITEFERRRLAPKLGFDPDAAPPPFGDFLRAVREQTAEERDIHWSTQVYLLRPDRIRYSFIGRFEMFREQFRSVCESLGIARFGDDLRNTAHATNAGKQLRTFFGRREIELVQTIYEQDFSSFGYGWSPEVL